MQDIEGACRRAERHVMFEAFCMRPPGKTVVDEFYVHLTALEHVESADARAAIKRVVQVLPNEGGVSPNVAKLNLRSGRVSLLAYPEFFDAPFPELVASWVFAPGSESPTSFRRYDDSLNPPILHRKELLLPSSHPACASWADLTSTAEGLGLFDDTTTIGFRLNWERLIASKGYRLIDETFLPIGNDVACGTDDSLVSGEVSIQRHLTALSRNGLSAPVQLLIRHGVLRPGLTFFDYGCGKGSDVAALRTEGYDANGWDPHYEQDAPKVSADVVNLGFVVNVIEDSAERVEALSSAFALARKAMVVGVMLYGGDLPGKPFRDGYLTSRGTFQKYFTQGELKDYLEQVLERPAVVIGPGVALVFKDSDAEQKYAVERYRSRGLVARLLGSRKQRIQRAGSPADSGSSHRPSARQERREVKPSPADLRLEAARPVLDRVWAVCLDLGRFPEETELSDFDKLRSDVGSLAKALRLITQHYDLELLNRASRARADDVLLFLATQHFAKRPAYRQLEPRLQRDVRAFFSDYRSALAAGHALLVEASDPGKILASCKEAAANGLGWLDGEHSLHLHVSMVERLPAVLRAYVACGQILWNSIGEVQLVKIHISSGKLTLMEFDDFDASPLPLLRRRVKVQVRRLDYDVFEYGGRDFPKPVLYRKSRYLNEDYATFADQLAFDEALEHSGVLTPELHGPSAEELKRRLESKRLAVDGLRLVRSQTLPDLDSLCGSSLTYRELIECGDTRQRLGIANLPIRADSYNALYDLANQLLDPIIEYFGAIRLTYGFASQSLTKHIKGGIAPRLDQHAACEHGARGALVCERGGAACDLVVEDEDMREVAQWIIANLPFDRLYFYGPDKPIHLSFSSQPKGEAFAMLRTTSGKLMPRTFPGAAST